MSSRARCEPRRAAKNECPPESSTAPIRANGDPIFASSAQYTTSQASAIPSPTPRHAPCTAAKVGAGKVAIRLMIGLTIPSRMASASSLPGSASARSRPAQNPAPSPLNNNARTVARSTCSKAATNSFAIAWLMALSLSGRLRTISASESLIVRSTAISYCPPGADCARAEIRSEHWNYVVRGNVPDLHSVDIEFGYRRKLDAPAFDEFAHACDSQPPIVRLLLVGEDSQSRFPRHSQQDAMVVQKIARQVPELLGRLPQHHRQEHETGAELFGDELAMLIREARPLLFEQAYADLQMARFVPSDRVEHLAEHRMGRGTRHSMEQRRRRNLAHHEGGENDRERVTINRAVIAGPVASAVVVEPVDIVERDLLQFAARGEALRSAGHQLFDHAAAALLVIVFVAGDGKEALADGVLLVRLPGADGGAGEHRRPRGIEVGKQRPPVHDRHFLVVAVGFGREFLPGQVGRVEALLLRALVNLAEFGRLAAPLHRKDVGLL